MTKIYVLHTRILDFVLKQEKNVHNKVVWLGVSSNLFFQLTLFVYSQVSKNCVS